MNEVKTQIRGTCQCCGRDQAVLAVGVMSKHGYTVEHGWFSGVCPGQNYKPLQQDRSQADAIVHQVRAECDALDALVAEFKAGTKHPLTVSTNEYDAKARDFKKIAWADADQHQRDRGLSAAIYRTEQRAKHGRSFANDLEKLANSVFGTELRTVVTEVLKPIAYGETRLGANGRKLVVTNIHGARIYWKDEKGFKGWTGAGAWRKFPMAA